MMAEERMRETRAVPETEEHVTEERSMMYPMRGGMMPTFMSRISWGAIFAGVFVAIASQLVLTALGAAIGFGTAAVTSVTALQQVSAGVGIWTAISAIISLFIGGYVASRVANAQLSTTGLWHGLVVWAVAVVFGILLGSLGVTGLLGFASNAAAVLRGILPTGVTVTPGTLNAAASAATTSALYFLGGSLIALLASLLGGWLGSARLSKTEAMRREEEIRMRRAA